MHQRTTLLTGEDRTVKLLTPLFTARGQNHSRTRPAQSLVDGRGDDIGMRNRGGMQACSNQACEVRHIDPQRRTDLVRNFAERSEVKVTRVGRPSRDQHAGTLTKRGLANLFRLDAHGLRINLVTNSVVVLTREVDAHAVSEVATMREGETEESISHVRHCHESRRIRLRTRVRLDVDIVRADKNFLRARNRKGLRNIDELASTVVAATRVALGVLVGQDRSLRFKNRARNKVLRGDHFQRALLAFQFLIQNRLDFRVELAQWQIVERIHLQSFCESGGHACPANLDQPYPTAPIWQDHAQK